MTLGSRTARTGSALEATAGALRLDRALGRLGLVEVVAGPQPIEQLETESAPQRFLDHLAVTLAQSALAWTLTARSTSSSIVNVVRVFDMSAS